MIELTLPPEPPAGMCWVYRPEDKSWLLVLDDVEVIREVNMSGGTGG